MQSVYVIGSLRNPEVPKLASLLRTHGYDVFDDWFAAGERADDNWQEYETQRGRTYKEAMGGAFAKSGFTLDKTNIERCDAVVMLMPAGKSGHLELGYAAGKGKRTYILFADGEPDRWDLMYQFASDVFLETSELVAELEKFNGR